MIKRNNLKTKVGLIATASPEETNPQGYAIRSGRAEKNIKKAEESLKKLGFEIYSSGKIGRTNTQMAHQGEELRKKGIHVLVLYVGSWAYSSNSVIAARKAGVPVIVWADTHLDSGGGLVGGSIIRGALEEVGIKNYLISGDFNDQETLGKLKTLCNGIAGATKLNGLFYGEGGSRSMGMVTARIDPSQWMIKFGIDVDGFEQAYAIEKASRIPGSQVQEFLTWFKKEFGKIEVKEEVLEAQARLYLALREIIEEKAYDFISVKCLPDMPYCYTTFCLAHSLLNNGTDDGFGETCPIVCSCETDANAALTMQILKNITGGPTAFADVLYYSSDDDILRLVNCGSMPTDFARSRKEVTWVKEDIMEFDWKIGGAYPMFVAKPGKITLARLSRVKGEYVMLITDGQALDMPLEKTKDTSSNRAHIFVKLNPDRNTFIKNLRSNHIHVVYGDYKKELVKTCEVLDIESILI